MIAGCQGRYLKPFAMPILSALEFIGRLSIPMLFYADAIWQQKAFEMSDPKPTGPACAALESPFS